MFEKKPKAAEPVLSEADARSAVYLKVKAYCEKRIERLRAKNDGDLDPAKTAVLRGQIKELKHLATLDKPAPQTEADDPVKD